MDNQAMDKQTPSRKSSRNLRWALGLSLAVNLVIVGAIAGAVYRHSGGGGKDRYHGPDMRSYATPYVRALPRDAQRALHDALRDRAGPKPPSRSERKAQYAQMLTALRRDPFDQQSVQDILRAQSQAVIGMQDAAHGVWLQQISAMSDAERAAFADRLEQQLNDRKHKWRKPKRD
ncbi:MAG: putative membrane protein [Sulfitobacter sp.]|jgi:uncharacterized membrane protein